MAKPIGERVATLETKVEDMRGSIDALKDTVEQSAADLKREIKAASLNGARDRVVALADTVGTAEDRAAIKSIIRQHDRMSWLSRPIVRAVGYMTLALISAAAGKYLGL